MKQTILIIEADPKIRDVVRTYLEKENYDVVEAVDGDQAKAIFLRYHPCLIILDTILPKINGVDFLTWVHGQESNEVSVIILSTKDLIKDKIAGLKMGADAYITKPFDPEELMAHVEAVLRRTGRFCQKLTYDGLTIMPRKGEVIRLDQAIYLTHFEFKLLYYLMKNKNMVFSREQLVMEIYPYHEQTVMDRTIDAHIKKVREKIEDIPSKPKRIQTVRGMGYKFVTQ